MARGGSTGREASGVDGRGEAWGGRCPQGKRWGDPSPPSRVAGGPGWTTRGRGRRDDVTTAETGRWLPVSGGVEGPRTKRRRPRGRGRAAPAGAQRGGGGEFAPRAHDSGARRRRPSMRPPPRRHCRCAPPVDGEAARHPPPTSSSSGRVLAERERWPRRVAAEAVQWWSSRPPRRAPLPSALSAQTGRKKK